MAIPASQVRALFTQMLIDVYQERIRTTSFLRSFFPTKKVSTRYVSIEVERMGEKIAVDVVRGTEGNRNIFAKSTQKIFEPPFYREFFDATQLDLYDRVLGSQMGDNSALFAQLMDEVADKLGALQDKIERSQELMCAQILETGIVTTKSGDNIDYKRKAASMVNLGSGQYFIQNADPFEKFAAGAQFLRTVGRSGEAMFVALLGEQAMADLLKNTVFLGRQDLVSLRLDLVREPIRNSVGAAYHGTITARSWQIQLWTYPQFYDDATDTTTTYWNTKKVAMFPSNPRFKMAFAAVPQLIEPGGKAPVQEAYVVGNFRNKRKAVDEFDIQTAPLPIPTAVDQIYTFQAVG